MTACIDDCPERLAQLQKRLALACVAFGVERSGSRGDVQRSRGGLVCKAHRLCVSLNFRLENNKEEKHKVERSGSKVACASRFCRCGFGWWELGVSDLRVGV